MVEKSRTIRNEMLKNNGGTRGVRKSCIKRNNISVWSNKAPRRGGLPRKKKKEEKRQWDSPNESNIQKQIA